MSILDDMNAIDEILKPRVIARGVITDADLKKLAETPGAILELVEPYIFPRDKKKIAALNMTDKLRWYSTLDPQVLVTLSNTREFVRFWNLTYVWRLRLIRFYYKLKNFEFFKQYPDITKIRKQRTKETDNDSDPRKTQRD